MTEKTTDTMSAMTFGEFVAGAYGARSRLRAKRLVRFAVSAQLAEFRGPRRLVISERQHEILSFKTDD